MAALSWHPAARTLEWAVLSRLHHDCFSAISSLSCSLSFTEFYRALRGQESAVSVVCSVLMPGLVGALSKSRCLTTMRGKKSDGRTMIRRDGRADSRQAHRSLLSPRDDEEKKSQASWSNPTKPIVNDRCELPSCFHHAIVRSKFSSKLSITL